MSHCLGWRISRTKSIVNSTTKTQEWWMVLSVDVHRPTQMEASSSPIWSSGTTTSEPFSRHLAWNCFSVFVEIVRWSTKTFYLDFYDDHSDDSTIHDMGLLFVLGMRSALQVVVLLASSRTCGMCYGLDVIVVMSKFAVRSLKKMSWFHACVVVCWVVQQMFLALGLNSIRLLVLTVDFILFKTFWVGSMRHSVFFDHL